MSIKLDPQQSVLLNELKNIVSILNQSHLMSFPRRRESRRWFSTLYRKFMQYILAFLCFLDSRLRGNDIKGHFPSHTTNPLKNGIYLFGTVGSGKTMLMKTFYDLLTLPKAMIHYQNFMQLIHKNIHNLQAQEALKQDMIAKVAKEYTNNIKVICIDEFEIKDITDAMIIGSLLSEFKKLGIFVFVTSNTEPKNLYLDGLQRDSFLPAVDKICQNFYVLNLDNKHDYRFDEIIKLNNQRIIYPKTSENKIKKIITDISKENNFQPQHIEIMGRELLFKKVSKKILLSDFTELFERDLGYIDYVNICQKFNVIIVENVKTILPENTDIAIRFINFIDNAYFYKVLLFMSIEVDLKDIYRGVKRANEFKRAISRLNEMNSEGYLSKIT